MNTIVENLSILESIKHDIGNAIVSKGGSVTDAFGGYAKAILDLPTGGGGDTSIEDGIIQGTLSGEYSNSRINIVKSYRFQGTDITTLDLQNCRYINTGAFQSCTNLTKINLPMCTSISNMGFQYCSKLSYINIPNCMYIANQAFNNVNYINLSQRVVFESNAFQDTYISRIVFEKVPSMAVLLFSNAMPSSIINTYFSDLNKCYSIPSASTTSLISGDWYGIASGLTRSNKNLVEVNLPNAWYIHKSAFINCTNLATVNLPEATFIGDSAFSSCYITNINAPKVSYVGVNAFYMGSFTSIDFPNCKYVEESAFNLCKLLQSINIPMCSYIGNRAFTNNSNLQSIDLPLCSFIGNYVFYNCRNLNFANIPMCEFISDSTFQECYSLSYVSPLYKCKYIGVNGFYNCSSLKYLYLPECSSIYQYAFYGCRNFSNLVLLSDSVCYLPNKDVFYLTPINSEGTGSIFVPSSLVTDYQTHSIWSRFSENIQPFELKNSGRIANDNIPLSIPESIFIKKSELGESKWTWWAGSQEFGNDIMLDIWYEDGKLKYDCHVNDEELQVPAIVNIETFYGEDYIHIMFDLSGFTTYEISEDDYITVTRPVDFYTL